MKILYVYPHPDDESFGGPARVMHQQRRAGHEVYLLTLTKGGATKQRFKYNYSVEQMGEVRYQEMLNVAQVLNLSGMQVLDFPDSGLKEVDPREIEAAIRSEIERIEPHVLVTYPVHGISGFHDHLVTHAAVKRVFCDLRGKISNLQRLAFETISEEEAKQFAHFHLNGSKLEEIDCVIEVNEEDTHKGFEALDCYVTYQETIEQSQIKKYLTGPLEFEIFQEQHEPLLTDLLAGLK